MICVVKFCCSCIVKFLHSLMLHFLKLHFPAGLDFLTSYEMYCGGVYFLALRSCCIVLYGPLYILLLIKCLPVYYDSCIVKGFKHVCRENIPNVVFHTKKHSLYHKNC